jgi:CheY-like chemotaxis protein
MVKVNEELKELRCMKTRQLLVVEDDPDNLALLTAILGDKYRIKGCTSVAEALLALEGFIPDLLVLDVGMRPVDGVEFLKAIRMIPGYGTIPAIALTGYARDGDKQRFLEAGFQAVVTKPIMDQAALESLIENTLNVRVFSRQLDSSNPAGHDVARGRGSNTEPEP